MGGSLQMLEVLLLRAWMDERSMAEKAFNVLDQT
jgi:hypothetical protein